MATGLVQVSAHPLFDSLAFVQRWPVHFVPEGTLGGLFVVMLVGCVIGLMG